MRHYLKIALLFKKKGQALFLAAGFALCRGTWACPFIMAEETIRFLANQSPAKARVHELECPCAPACQPALNSMMAD